MGNYTLTIIGTGCHHNGKPDDAEQVAQRVVDELRAFGHSINHAIITFGSHHHLRLHDKVEPKE